MNLFVQDEKFKVHKYPPRFSTIVISSMRDYLADILQVLQLPQLGESMVPEGFV